MFSHIFVCQYNLLFFGLCNIAKKEAKLNFPKQKLGLNDEEMADWKQRYENYLKEHTPLSPKMYPQLAAVLKTYKKGAQNPVVFTEVQLDTCNSYIKGYYVCTVPGLYSISASISTSAAKVESFVRLYKNSTIIDHKKA